jgi:hypothetical protein
MITTIGAARPLDRITRITPIIRTQLPMLTPPCGGAQIIYSAAGGRRSVPRAGAVCPRYVMPLCYEHYDARVGCLA